MADSDEGAPGLSDLERTSVMLTACADQCEALLMEYLTTHGLPALRSLSNHIDGMFEAAHESEDPDALAAAFAALLGLAQITTGPLKDGVERLERQERSQP